MVYRLFGVSCSTAGGNVVTQIVLPRQAALRGINFAVGATYAAAGNGGVRVQFSDSSASSLPDYSEVLGAVELVGGIASAPAGNLFVPSNVQTNGLLYLWAGCSGAGNSLLGVVILHLFIE